ncbi:hypothetical protein SDC9_93826 [bioreactor metagenome]|uniref:Uncharacterized protein n=1 Tax=bioreactor metagenome TaxID=1076179 RepID=A0A645A318_9ZZZZ
MRSKHTGRKETSVYVVPQQVVAYRESNGKRKDKGEETKDKAFVFIGDKLVQIKFQPYDKHNVKQSDRREHRHTRVIIIDKIQSERANDHSRNNKSDNTRHIEAFQQNRSQQNNSQQHRKDKNGIGKRQCKFVRYIRKKIVHRWCYSDSSKFRDLQKYGKYFNKVVIFAG